MQRYIYIVETGKYICDFCNKPTNIAKIFLPLALKARIVAHFGAQHCSSLCSQSEGREDESAATAEFVALFAIGFVPLTLQAK